jgi:Flp pilus assembly protein TadD
MVWPWKVVVLAAALGLAIAAGCSESRRPGLGREARHDAVRTDSGRPGDLPPSAKTLYSMAKLLAAQGKDMECEFLLRRCITQYPRFAPAYNQLAELQMRQGRVHEAVDTLSAALAVRPHDPVLSNNLGMCFLARKEYGKSLGCFTEAAGRVPESRKYRANMATSLGLMGRYAESLALFQQILPSDQAKQNAELLRKAHDSQTEPAASASPAASGTVPVS